MASRLPAALTRKIAPVSRIQQSLTGISPITCTAEPQAALASATLTGFAHMTTASYFAIVRATSAMLARAPASADPQIALLSGHAIHVRSCGVESSGARKPDRPPVVLARASATATFPTPAAAAARNARRDSRPEV